MKNIISKIKLVALTIAGLALTAVSAKAQNHIPFDKPISISGIQGQLVTIGHCGTLAHSPANYGYQITYVVPNTPGYFSGLRAGDILTVADNYRLSPHAPWSLFEQRFLNSGALNVQYLRNGRTYYTGLTYGVRPGGCKIPLVPVGGVVTCY